MPVFQKALIKEFSKAVSKLDGLAYGQAKRSFDVKKREMLGDFNSHDITVELNQGPTADSEILENGNLYSLLGFPAGQDPTEPIYDVLDKKTTIERKPEKILPKNTKVEFYYRVNIPTQKEIENEAKKANPLPWDGRSWLSLVENGIPGFMYYIFHKFFPSPPSFSTTGLQSKNKVRSNKLGKKSYISDILANFRKKFD